MATLKIDVSRLDKSNVGKFKTVYINSLIFNDNTNIPFNKLYESLRILYPFDDAVITFKLI